MMNFVQYVQGLGWTPEQVAFLAMAALVIVLGICGFQAVKRVWKEQSRVIEVATLEDQLEDLRGRLERLESDFNDDDDDDDDAETQAVSQCLKALAASWPQHDSECAKAGMRVLLQHAATHPDRNKREWQELIARADSLVADFVKGSANDPETTELVKKRVQQVLAGAVSSIGDDPAAVELARKLFRDILAKSEATLLANPPAEMVAALEKALSDAIQSWLEDEDDEDVNKTATTLFRQLLSKRADSLADSSSKLPEEFDESLLGRVIEMLNSQDEELEEQVLILAKKIVEARGSAILRGEMGQVQQLDDALLDVIISHIENDELDPTKDMVLRVVKSRCEVLCATPPDRLVDLVDDQLSGDAEDWLDNNPDEVLSSAERLAKAVLATQAKALEEDPPSGVVERVRDTVTEAVDDQLDALGEEVSSAARRIATSAIARASQES